MLNRTGDCRHSGVVCDCRGSTVSFYFLFFVYYGFLQIFLCWGMISLFIISSRLWSLRDIVEGHFCVYWVEHIISVLTSVIWLQCICWSDTMNYPFIFGIKSLSNGLRHNLYFHTPLKYLLMFFALIFNLLIMPYDYQYLRVFFVLYFPSTLV